MLMLPRSRRLWGFGWMILVPALALGPGCSSRPENNPYLRKQFKNLADVQDQVGDLALQMKQMTAELAAMRKDMADVKSLNGGGEAVAKIEQIDTRVQTLEQEIGKRDPAAAKARQVASADTETKDSSSEPAPAPVREKGRSAPKVSTSTHHRTHTVSAAASALPVRQVSQVTAPKPRGQYYTIKTGDSPASIAKTHGIEVSTLLRANRLPKDATVFPGQKLYVPATD